MHALLVVCWFVLSLRVGGAFAQYAEMSVKEVQEFNQRGGGEGHVVLYCLTTLVFVAVHLLVRLIRRAIPPQRIPRISARRVRRPGRARREALGWPGQEQVRRRTKRTHQTTSR